MRRLAVALVLAFALAGTRADAQVVSEQLRTRTAAQLTALDAILTAFPPDDRRYLYICSDCASTSNCTTGSGTTENVCRWSNDTDNWEVIGGGAGSGDIESVWTDTTGDVSALTAAAGDTLDAGSADASSPATRSTSLSGTCTEGQFHQDTDSGGTEVYVCTATNTWTKFIAATDNVATATALAANGANCSAGSYPLGVDASGATETCTAWHSESGTLTNQTLDVEGTGNTVTVTAIIPLRPAVCQNATATLLWDYETANTPAAACVTGTNTQKAYADFDQTTDECLQTTLPLPDDWTGTVDVAYTWLTTATSGSVAWCTQIICVADAETDDPAFPAQASGNCVSDAAKGTTNQLNLATDTGITITGCAASEQMHIRTCRDPNETGGQTDTVAADARLADMYLKVRRAL